MRKFFGGWIFWLAVLPLAGCGHGALQEQDEALRTAWADMTHECRQRVDLLPSLLSIVARHSDDQSAQILAVNAARDRALQIATGPGLLDDAVAFADFQAAQSGLSDAVTTMLAATVTDAELQSDADFRDLRAQLEVLERDIAQARDRYRVAVKAYNATVNDFPTNLTAGMFDYEEKPQVVGPGDSALGSSPAPQAASL